MLVAIQFSFFFVFTGTILMMTSPERKKICSSKELYFLNPYQRKTTKACMSLFHRNATKISFCQQPILVELNKMSCVLGSTFQEQLGQHFPLHMLFETFAMCTSRNEKDFKFPPFESGWTFFINSFIIVLQLGCNLCLSLSFRILAYFQDGCNCVGR